MLARRIVSALFLLPIVYYTLMLAPSGIGTVFLPVWHWALPLSALSFAVLIALVTRSWAADRGRRLTHLFETTERYCLAYLMLHFGITKLYPGQFISYHRDLDLTLGDVAPFRLAWRFLGYSPTYVAYTASLEILAGALLWWRRTAAVGLIISVGVMSNIAVIDYAFGIPPLALAVTMGLVSIVLLVAHGDRLRALVASADGTTSPPQSTTVRGLAIVSILVALLLGGGYLTRQSLATHESVTGRWEVLGCTPAAELPLCQPIVDTALPRLYLEIGKWGELVVGAERERLRFSYENASGILTIDSLRVSALGQIVSLQGHIAANDSMVTLAVSGPLTEPFDLRLKRTKRAWYFTEAPR